MIILTLRCGLGNQLFEYAYARHLMHKLGEKKIYLDLSIYKHEPDGRKYKLEHFTLPDDTVVLTGLRWVYHKLKRRIIIKTCAYKVIRKKMDRKRLLFEQGIYDWNFDRNDSVFQGKTHYLHGIFQNHWYFDYMRDEIKACYQLKETSLNQANAEMLQKIETTEAVCVHIRRGDYVSSERWSKELLICDETYYLKGISYIRERIPKAVFYIFSNSHEDILSIKEDYNLPEGVVFIDMHNSDIDDFRLMCKCKHFILSNSSFSWWAQYLSDHCDGIVVAPSYWDTQKNHYEGIYMDNWVEIAL